MRAYAGIVCLSMKILIIGSVQRMGYSITSEAWLFLQRKAAGNDKWLNDGIDVDNHFYSAAGIMIDVSRQMIESDSLQGLLRLAGSVNMSQAIKCLLEGQWLNQSENQLVTHTCSRKYYADDQREGTGYGWESFRKWVNLLRSGEKVFSSMHKLKSVVHIGIGGSHLGPALLFDSLGNHQDAPFALHFVSSNDRQEIDSVLAQCDPCSTLFIIVSKSFTSAEPLANAQIAKEWLRLSVEDADLQSHFMAITAQPEIACRWGITADRILNIPPGVGGRLSIWSAVALSVAAYCGLDVYSSLVAGACAMDGHFAAAALKDNMPVIMALLAVWHINFKQHPTRAILAYDANLGLLVPYLQQLFMESLGKRVGQEGQTLKYNTGAIIWGGRGPDTQHSFHQLLMQGSHRLAADFILPIESSGVDAKDREVVWANALAQAQVLQRGYSAGPEQTIAGGISSNMLLLPKLDAYHLGALIALYEHQVFCQSVIWGVNAYDQWGVQRAKVLSKQILTDDRQQLDQTVLTLQQTIARYGGESTCTE